MMMIPYNTALISWEKCDIGRVSLDSHDVPGSRVVSK